LFPEGELELILESISTNIAHICSSGKQILSSTNVSWEEANRKASEGTLKCLNVSAVWFRALNILKLFFYFLIVQLNLSVILFYFILFSGAIYICTRSHFGKHPLWHERSGFYWSPERNWNSCGG
jgi:hypothetical protein